MRAEFVDALDQVARERGIRALVLTGAGRAFCAGGDIRAMQQRAQAPAGEIAFNGWSRQQRTHQAVAMLHAMPKPVMRVLVMVLRSSAGLSSL